ncbi:uncharacterized protein LOC121264357 [Juglans microcarpa x Juglans regia]|uniref:uncharacterized protein LOC121264357 n=1 Tax=Juglans microcarpa x Juglans regia TaxID=2249226 RepID=UPI001B7DA06B|nr:uncharacterized protein LOC121264357 [Juglans microcarpa x Juglans regia]
MSMVWIALKNSLDCRKLQLPSGVHDPEADGNPSTSEKRPGRSRCLGSISNLREKPLGCSARTPWSSESLNPVTHKIVLDDPTTCETKTGPLCVSHKDRDRGRDIGPTFVGNLRPWTTDHSHRVPHFKPSGPTSSIRTHGGSIIFDDGGGGIHICSKVRRSNETDYNGSSTSICQMCGEKFRKLDAIEGHRLSKHAVIELGEGDSSRKIVEKICQKSWLKTENNCRRMERVLKVQNMPKNVSCFEEHRETMKIKASRLPKRHPRCLVDGNELLMFYGTTVVCSLGMNNDSCSLCTLDNCGVCQALRHGFFAKKECNGGLGVFTTSSSERALESIETDEADRSVRKALMVCRVVAGRVHKPGESIQDMTASGFDSLARKMGSHSNVEELYVLNPQAILPCFVVIISKGSFV